MTNVSKEAELRSQMLSIRDDAKTSHELAVKASEELAVTLLGYSDELRPRVELAIELVGKLGSMLTTIASRAPLLHVAGASGIATDLLRLLMVSRDHPATRAAALFFAAESARQLRKAVALIQDLTDFPTPILGWAPLVLLENEGLTDSWAAGRDFAPTEHATESTCLVVAMRSAQELLTVRPHEAFDRLEGLTNLIAFARSFFQRTQFHRGYSLVHVEALQLLLRFRLGGPRVWSSLAAKAAQLAAQLEDLARQAEAARQQEQDAAQI